MVEDPGQRLFQSSGSAGGDAYLGGEVGGVIEGPVAEVREGGVLGLGQGVAAIAVGALPEGGRGAGHAGELVVIG